MQALTGHTDRAHVEIGVGAGSSRSVDLAEHVGEHAARHAEDGALELLDEHVGNRLLASALGENHLEHLRGLRLVFRRNGWLYRHVVHQGIVNDELVNAIGGQCHDRLAGELSCPFEYGHAAAVIDGSSQYHAWFRMPG